MDLLQAVAIAIMQGATELFPVSSLGHAVLLPALLGFTLDEHAATFLPFLVLLHLGTVGALLAYFWRDWWQLAQGLLGLGGDHRRRESLHILLLMIIATIPAVVVGGVLEKVGLGRKVFGTPMIAASFLMVNGVILLVGQKLRDRHSERRALAEDTHRPIATLTYTDAAVVGLWQCLALIPGLSRSGVTIVGGMRRGLSPEGAAHFSFLIAIPIIMAATVLEVPKLLHGGVAHGVLHTASIAAVAAGITAVIAIAIMMRLFRDHENWALTPFAIYCIVLGAIGVGVLAL